MSFSVNPSEQSTPIHGFLNGYLQSGGANGQVLAGMVSPVPAQVRYVVAAAQGGGATTVVDVLNNGTSIWTNPADRPTLTGTASGKFASGRVNHSTVRPGDSLLIVLAIAGNKTQVIATVALEHP
jgi:hypothetical protein